MLTVVTARREPARRRVCGKTLGSKPRPWQPQPDRVIQFLDGTFKETRDSNKTGKGGIFYVLTLGRGRNKGIQWKPPLPPVQLQSPDVRSRVKQRTRGVGIWAVLVKVCSLRHDCLHSRLFYDRVLTSCHTARNLFWEAHASSGWQGLEPLPSPSMRSFVPIV